MVEQGRIERIAGQILNGVALRTRPCVIGTPRLLRKSEPHTGLDPPRARSGRCKARRPRSSVCFLPCGVSVAREERGARNEERGTRPVRGAQIRTLLLFDPAAGRKLRYRQDAPRNGILSHCLFRPPLSCIASRRLRPPPSPCSSPLASPAPLRHSSHPITAPIRYTYPALGLRLANSIPPPQPTLLHRP